MIIVLDRLARRFVWFAQLGALIALGHVVAALVSGFWTTTVIGVLGLFWLLAIGVIVPLALTNYTQARVGSPAHRLLDVVRWLYLPAWSPRWRRSTSRQAQWRRSSRCRGSSPA